MKPCVLPAREGVRGGRVRTRAVKLPVYFDLVVDAKREEGRFPKGLGV